MNMKSLLEAMTKFAGEPAQKPGDQVKGTDKASKAKSGKHPFLNQLVGEAHATKFERGLKQEYKVFKESSLKDINDYRSKRKELQRIQLDPGTAKDPELKAELARRKASLEKEARARGFSESDDNLPVKAHDVIKVDVPLLIRLLEYAREDAKSDMELHSVTEKLIELCSTGNVLNMDSYDEIVGHAKESAQLDELVGEPIQPTQATATPSPQDLQKAEQEKQNLAKNLTQLKAAGVDIDPQKASQTLAKTDNKQPLGPVDKDNLAKMAPAIGNIVANPQLAGQFKALIQKAEQGK